MKSNYFKMEFKKTSHMGLPWSISGVKKFEFSPTNADVISRSVFIAIRKKNNQLKDGNLLLDKRRISTLRFVICFPLVLQTKVK